VKILITGAQGMLGRALGEILSLDHEVSGVDIQDADIRVSGDIERLIVRTRPELVIHAAANTDVDGCEKNENDAYAANALGTKNVAVACRKAGARCMYVSTDFVFDGEKETPYSESDLPNPINVYGRSKYMGEALLARALPDHYILRTEWLFGGGGRNFIDEIIKRARREGKLRVVDDQRGSPTYTRDLAEMIRNMLTRMPPSGIYHLTNGGACTWYEFAREILSLVGLSHVSMEPVSQEEIKRPAKRPRNSVMRNLAYEREGFPPARHWREALLEYLRAVHGVQPDLAATEAREGKGR
jgi:dTDP-4-dehydrorhamnose reductase